MNARLLGSIVGISFLLNLVWENAQAPLYTGYQNFLQHFWICFKATLGDVFIVLIMYSAIALLTKDQLWIQHLNSNTITVSVLMGIGLALIIEGWALATGRWSYDGMPLIPFGGVGFLPVLQMAVLPLLTFHLTNKMVRHI